MLELKAVPKVFEVFRVLVFVFFFAGIILMENYVMKNWRAPLIPIALALDFYH
jgi:hypothetical protein